MTLKVTYPLQAFSGCIHLYSCAPVDKISTDVARREVPLQSAELLVIYSWSPAAAAAATEENDSNGQRRVSKPASKQVCERLNEERTIVRLSFAFYANLTGAPVIWSFASPQHPFVRYMRYYFCQSADPSASCPSLDASRGD